MKKILFPTDFSKPANAAFQYVLHFAKRLDARIITLHAYSLPDIKGVNLPRTLEEVYNSITLEEFENYRDAIPILHTMAEEAGFADIPMYHVMKEGHPVSAILSTIEKDEIDLVVMGTKGTGWLREVFIGSVTAEVLEEAPCLVLAVPMESVFDGTVDHIAFAVELKEEEHETIKSILDFANRFEAVLTCIHVDLAHTEELTERMQKFASRYQDVPNLRFQVLDGTDALEVVADYVEENHFDMVAMTTHKRNFWQELWNYSMTKQMTRIVNAPILCVKANK